MNGARAARPLRVALFSGGPSSEHDVSIASGRNVARLLDPDRFVVRPVAIGRDARFRLAPSFGAPGPAAVAAADAALATGEAWGAARAIERLVADGTDVAFLALHGPYGEDGTIQGLLAASGLRHTGSGVATSALAMDKANARHVLAGNGIPVAKGILLPRRGDERAIAERVRREIDVPCVVKPNNLGSSHGVSVVRAADELPAALVAAFETADRVLVEEYVAGLELTCGVLGNAGSSGCRALPPTEIRAPEGRFFDYDVKYRPGAAQEITPAPIPPELTRLVQDLALRAHECLDCRGLSRTDFRVRDGGAPIALEVNTLPGFTETSLFPQAAAAAGIPFRELLTRVVELALEDGGA